MRSSPSGDLRESRRKGRQWGPPLAVRSAILKTEAGGGYATCLDSVIKLKNHDLSPERELWSRMTHSACTCSVTCYCAGVLSGVTTIPLSLCNVRQTLKHFYMTVLVLWLGQMSGHSCRKMVWQTQQAAEMCLRQPLWDWLRVLRPASWVRSGFNETSYVGISSIHRGHEGPEENAISGYAGEFALVL